MCRAQSSRDAARLRCRRPHRRRQLLAGPAGACLPRAPKHGVHTSLQDHMLMRVIHENSIALLPSTPAPAQHGEPASLHAMSTIAAATLPSHWRVLPRTQVRHKVTGRQYALKVVDKHLVLRHRLVGQLRQERNILDRCAHPAVARLHFTFQDEGAVYLGLELCPNGPQQTLLDSEMLMVVPISN